ncbi:MAG: DUF4419 domain-containing protein [Treponema sp.]|nr:DUF4419 domain-containing protein [Treponema sp.]
MKIKKAAILLLVMQFILLTTCSKQSSDYEQIADTWETNPSYTAVPVSPDGITFTVDAELSKPEEHLTMLPYNDVLEYLINLSQGENKKKSANIVAQNRLPGSMVNVGYHSFFDGIYHAYMDHRPVVLSPDVIWLLISQGFAQHINANAEKMRRHFVNFDGKLTLIVRSPYITLENPDSPWETVFPEFTQKIAEHTGEALINVLSADFTTTTIVEKVASEITVMESMKAYFDYIVFGDISCGIPEFTLLGTTEDWQKILDKTKQLGRYELKWWTDALEPVLQEFVNASQGNINKEFWMNILDEKRFSGGCGPSLEIINGWIVKFFPYGNNGKRNSLWSIEKNDFTDEIVKVDLLYYNVVTEVSTPLELWAGIFGLEQNIENFALTPKIGWMIKIADPENSDLAKKLEISPASISVRVMEFPAELLSLRGIGTLTIDFINKITIPDAFAGKRIGHLILKGKIKQNEINRIKRMFPESNITINGKKVK